MEQSVLTCKQQKLKVLRFSGFHPNLGKAYVVLASSVLKVL